MRKLPTPPEFDDCSCSIISFVQSDSKTEEAVVGVSLDQSNGNPVLQADTLMQEVAGCVAIILFCLTEGEQEPVRNSSG